MNEILEMLKSLDGSDDFTVITSLLRLGYAFILTFFLSLTYKFLHAEKEDCHVMMHTMVYIGVIMAGAMMMIGANMVVAFGLLGAVSIVRFRTAVRNPIDMSYLFLSIVIGISCGLAFYLHALIISLFVGILMLVFSYFKFGMAPPSTINCVITVTAKKRVFKSDTMSRLNSIIGNGARMMEILTTNGTVKIKYSQILDNVTDVRTLHEDIEEFFDKDPSLKIKITRE